MKLRIGLVAALAALIVACDKSATAPQVQADEGASLALDVEATLDSATLVPRGPYYDSAPPDAIKLTDAQKAAIQKLHDAFAAAHKTQFDQLAAIRLEARAAVKAGKTRTEVGAILAKGMRIMAAMKPDFDALRAAVAAILTPEQKAWAASHQRTGPGPLGGPLPGRP